MGRCVAYGCHNTSVKKVQGITYHRFPKNIQLRKKWVRAVNRIGWEPSSYSCLCANHFLEADIDRTSLSSVRLREGAIPTLFMENGQLRIYRDDPNAEDPIPIKKVAKKKYTRKDKDEMLVELGDVNSTIKEMSKKIKVLHQTKRRLIRRLKLLHNVDPYSDDEANSKDSTHESDSPESLADPLGITESCSDDNSKFFELSKLVEDDIQPVEESELNEKPARGKEDVFDQFCKYMSTILRQLPGPQSYRLQKRFLDEAISAKLEYDSQQQTMSPTENNTIRLVDLADIKQEPLPDFEPVDIKSTCENSSRTQLQELVNGVTHQGRTTTTPGALLENSQIKTEVNDDDASDSLSSMVGRFRCPLCGSPFFKGVELIDHYKAMHPGFRPILKNGPRSGGEPKLNRPCPPLATFGSSATHQNDKLHCLS